VFPRGWSMRLFMHHQDMESGGLLHPSYT